MESSLYEEYSKLLLEQGVKFQAFDLESITEKDVLLIIDCQNDFFPEGTVEDGGRFGVDDGEKIVPSVNQLIDVFAKKGGVIAATKDFHSIHHCSFTPNGGAFPPHCIQGAKGSEFHKEIGAKLAEAKAQGATVLVGYKGIEDAHDCFSAYPYTSATGKERFGADFETNEWYNCFVLESSRENETMDCHPDVMAIYKKRSLMNVIGERLSEQSRFIVCGLAFDYCVIDSAINVRENTHLPVFIAHPATRASHIPGVGAFGSGFLNNPKELSEKLQNYAIAMIDLFSVCWKKNVETDRSLICFKWRLPSLIRVKLGIRPLSR